MEFRMEKCRQRDEHTRLFELLLKGELGRVEIEELCREVIGIAKQHLERLRYSRHWRFDGVGLSLNDVAVDAVAELLAPNGDEPCAHLRRGLIAMDGKLGEAQTLCDRVHRLIHSHLQQSVAHILTDYDAAHAKLQRALRREVAASPELKMHLVNGRRMYSLTATEILTGLPFMPPEELAMRIGICTVHATSTRRQRSGAPENPSVRMLICCLDFLATQDEYRRAVHEHDVLWLTKKILATEYEAATEESYECHPSDVSEGEIRSDINSVLERTRAWMEGAYVRKGKLTAAEAKSMSEALKKYCLNDEDGEREPLTRYLRLRGLDAESRNNGGRIFEYIVNHFRAEIRKLSPDICPSDNRSMIKKRVKMDLNSEHEVNGQ